MSKLHDTINQQVRETCRACHNVCFVSADADGVAPPVPAEGYRCEGCEAAGYERYDFDKSLPRPEATEATGDTEPIEATDPTEATEQGEATEIPFDAGSAESGAPIGSSSPVDGEPSTAGQPPDFPSEARPSDEPKSPEGEVVQVGAPPPEAEASWQ